MMRREQKIEEEEREEKIGEEEKIEQKIGEEEEEKKEEETDLRRIEELLRALRGQAMTW